MRNLISTCLCVLFLLGSVQAENWFFDRTIVGKGLKSLVTPKPKQQSPIWTQAQPTDSSVRAQRQDFLTSRDYHDNSLGGTHFLRSQNITEVTISLKVVPLAKIIKEPVGKHRPVGENLRLGISDTVVPVMSWNGQSAPTPCTVQEGPYGVTIDTDIKRVYDIVGDDQVTINYDTGELDAAINSSTRVMPAAAVNEQLAKRVWLAFREEWSGPQHMRMWNQYKSIDEIKESLGSITKSSIIPFEKVVLFPEGRGVKILFRQNNLAECADRVAVGADVTSVDIGATTIQYRNEPSFHYLRSNTPEEKAMVSRTRRGGRMHGAPVVPGLKVATGSQNVEFPEFEAMIQRLKAKTTGQPMPGAQGNQGVASNAPAAPAAQTQPQYMSQIPSFKAKALE